MEELYKQIEERIIFLKQEPNDINIGKISELTLVNMRLKQLMLGGVVGQSEQLKAFVDWWHGLSQEELVWYEGRYVEVFLSL